jgi:hypothetical protein
MSALEINHQSSEITVTELPTAAARTGKTPLYRKLYVQVLIAVALGAIIGYVDPDLSIALKPYGDAFVRAIKVVVAPIIFTTIAVGIAKMGDIRHVATVGVRRQPQRLHSASYLVPVLRVDRQSDPRPPEFYRGDRLQHDAERRNG